jgi:2-iminobutanoate/2-iminopropanoate deaminase
MTTFLNPDTIAAPVGAYSHGVLSPAAGNWLHVSGQIGVRSDGALASGFAAQAHAAWSNLVAILESAGMDAADLVKVTTFLVNAADLKDLGPVRSGFLGGARPASTVLVIAALARPEWLIEIEAVAHRP